MKIKINGNGDILDIGDHLPDKDNDVGYIQGEPPAGFSKETMNKYRFDFSTGNVKATEATPTPGPALAAVKTATPEELAEIKKILSL